MDKWYEWNAWYPVWTYDVGILWAFPWKRKPVFWTYVDVEHFPGVGVIDPPIIVYRKDKP